MPKSTKRANHYGRTDPNYRKLRFNNSKYEYNYAKGNWQERYSLKPRLSELIFTTYELKLGGGGVRK